MRGDLAQGLPGSQPQIQVRLWSVWNRMFRCRLVERRSPFDFSDFHYCEMKPPIAPHPQAPNIQSDPMQIFRPEGGWRRTGSLDWSIERSSGKQAA